MLISLDKIINDFNPKIKGVLHIGAHYGEEYSDYVRYGIKNMIFFEPVKANYQELIYRIPHVTAFNLALGNETGTKEIYIETANQGQSCSLLEPGTHLKQYPSITFPDKEIVRINKLDNVEFDRTDFNMINIDVQGYELEVFKGAKETLKTIDIIYSEVNFEEVYKGCCLIGELDEFLKDYGFVRVLTDDSPKSWGDALYLKR